MQSYLSKAAIWRNQDSLDPDTTHLPFLAGLIDSHSDFIRSGIRTQNSQNTHQRLNIMSVLEREAHERRDTEQVTYRWWVLFNLRLAILATFGNSLKPKYLQHLISTNKSLKGEEGLIYFPDHELFSLFPEMIFAPIINGRLGIFSINRTHTTRVYPLGLINKIDLENNPYNFFRHDVFHAKEIDRYIRKWKKEGIFEESILSFHRAFLRKMDTLPQRERRTLEWVYFYLFHENPDRFLDVFSHLKKDSWGIPAIFKQVVQEIEQEL